MYEVKYVEFKNKNWNYLKVVQGNNIIIYINKKTSTPPGRSQNVHK